MIEEIIVNNSYRGKQLGKILIASLVEMARVLGCRQVGLNCKDPMIKFYQGFGFLRDSDFMMLRIPTEEVQCSKVPLSSQESGSMFNRELLASDLLNGGPGTACLKVRPISSTDIKNG